MFLMINVTSVLTVFFLVFLEGLLSLDNALALAMLVRHLPKADQKKALTYGIWGAFAFRALAIFFLTHLMHLGWVKIAGGVYLLYVALRESLSKEERSEKTLSSSWFQFWRTILMVEMMDIAFSADSILAAVSVSSNYWIVLTGGILGIIMMRFAARAFIWLMERFPRLETTAILLVGMIGAKLICQGVVFLQPGSAWDWAFRFGFVGSIAYGFGYKRMTDPLAHLEKAHG